MNTSRILCLAFTVGLLTMPVVSLADTLLQKIATAVLADKFGIDTREVVQLRQQTGLPVYELAPIYEGAHYFDRSPNTVWQLRKRGLGWGQIAHKVGMHPGTFNKLRKSGAFDQDQFWTNSYRDRFGSPTTQVQVIRKQGGSLEDVLGAIIVGKLTNNNPRQIYDQYMTQKSWTTIATNNNVRFEEWRRVSQPVRTRFVISSTMPKYKIKSNKGVRDHGKGIGKGKSQGKSELHRGKGKSVAKGKPEDKGQSGKGKGHGKGKGKGG